MEIATRRGLHLRQVNATCEWEWRDAQSDEVVNEIEVGVRRHSGDVVDGEFVHEEVELLDVGGWDGVDVAGDGLGLSRNRDRDVHDGGDRIDDAAVHAAEGVGNQVLQQQLVHALHRVQTARQLLHSHSPQRTVVVVDETEQRLHHRHVQNARQVVVRDEDEEDAQRAADRVVGLTVREREENDRFAGVLENGTDRADDAG